MNGAWFVSYWNPDGLYVRAPDALAGEGTEDEYDEADRLGIAVVAGRCADGDAEPPLARGGRRYLPTLEPGSAASMEPEAGEPA